MPLKAVALAKTRMAPELSAAQRRLLLHRTFERVAVALTAANSVAAVLVVVGDEEGRRWAADHGFVTMAEPAGGGLNGALAAADARLGGQATVVVPADLPLVTGSDIDAVAAALPAVPGVVVVPTADGGTGALLRAPTDVIAPAFGPASAQAHLAAARRAGVAGRRLDVAGLALDLDRPADLARAGGWSAVTGGRTLARRAPLPPTTREDDHDAPGHHQDLRPADPLGDAGAGRPDRAAL